MEGMLRGSGRQLGNLHFLYRLQQHGDLSALPSALPFPSICRVTQSDSWSHLPSPFLNLEVSLLNTPTLRRERWLWGGCVRHDLSSARWWHWQERPVTVIWINRAEMQCISGWRCRAQGLVILWTIWNKHVLSWPHDTMWCLPRPRGCNMQSHDLDSYPPATACSVLFIMHSYCFHSWWRLLPTSNWLTLKKILDSLQEDLNEKSKTSGKKAKEYPFLWNFKWVFLNRLLQFKFNQNKVKVRWLQAFQR